MNSFQQGLETMKMNRDRLKQLIADTKQEIEIKLRDMEWQLAQAEKLIRDYEQNYAEQLK